MAKPVPKPEFDRKTNKGIGGRAKRSGTYFEYMAEDEFTTEFSNARRVVGSGAFGVISREPRLLGDVRIDFENLGLELLAEAKFGYGGKSQITIKREWIEKIKNEAALVRRYPALLLKFKGARSDTSKLIVFTWETFMKIMKELDERVE